MRRGRHNVQSNISLSKIEQQGNGLDNVFVWGGWDGWEPLLLEEVKEGHLERVDARVDIGDVDPLTIDVVRVGIGAVHRDALVAVIGAFVDGLGVVAALVVLQAERGLVTLSYLHSRR